LDPGDGADGVVGVISTGEVAELGDGGVVRDPEIDAQAEAYAGVVDEVEVKLSVSSIWR
jgi:hypothetical protein